MQTLMTDLGLVEFSLRALRQTAQRGRLEATPRLRWTLAQFAPSRQGVPAHQAQPAAQGRD